MANIFQEEIINECGAVMAEKSFGVKAENLANIFEFLRSQIYSDEPRAVIREISTNAFDAHLVACKGDVPFQVTLPDLYDPMLRIRDFGNGLTDDEVLNVYTSYAESTKNNDPNQNGMFGLGCKSPFCYGDSFLVNSYKNGVLTMFNAFIDPSNIGKMIQLSKSETAEPNGLEVIIPVKNEDIAKFRETAISVYSHFEVVPNITNATQDELNKIKNNRSKEAIFSGNGWKFFGVGESSIVVRNVAYPINPEVFTQEELSPKARQILTGGIVIHSDSQNLEPSISRESLKYTPRTKKQISNILNDIVTDLSSQCGSLFDKISTVWDAKIFYKESFDYYGKLHNIRDLFSGAPAKCRGYSVSDDRFSLSGNQTFAQVHCHSYFIERHGNLKCAFSNDIRASKKSIVCINDIKAINGIKNRILRFFYTLPLARSEVEMVYVLSFTSEEQKKAWIAKTGFDGKTYLLSSLEKEPLSKYFGEKDTTYTKNKKHQSQEFEFVRGGSASKNSDFWEPVDIDLDSDSGVYIEIEHFQYKLNGCDNKPKDLNYLLRRFEMVGTVVPKIYGIKKGSMEKIKKNKNMLHFSQWAKETLTSLLTSQPDIEQAIANHIYWEKEVCRVQDNLQNLCLMVKLWGLPGSSLLKEFAFKAYEIRQSESDKVKNLWSLCSDFDVKINKTNSYDVLTNFYVLKNLYPMMFEVLRKTPSYSLGEWREMFFDYVNLVDKNV